MSTNFSNYYKFWLYFIAVSGFLISIFAGWYIYDYYKKKENLTSELVSKEIVTLIQKHMTAYEQVLKSGAAFFNASDYVSRNDWRIFVKGQKLYENFKGIQGFGYSQVVLPQNRQKHEERIRKEGFPNYTIRPEGDRKLFAPVVYLEPFNERNKKALGYDVFSEKVRREAMTKAMQSGKAVITGKIKLIQEKDKDIQAGFLMYLPVYKKNSPLTSVHDRTLAIQGFVSAPFRAKDLMKGILETMFFNTNFRVYDGNLTNQENILYDSNTLHDSIALYKNINLTMNNRTWTIAIKKKNVLKSENAYIIIVIPFFILILTYLMYLLLNSLIRTKENALKIAKKATQELNISEERLRFAMEGSGDGIWDWNIKTNEVYFSKRWKEMLGFKDYELAATLDEWKRRVHPEDLEHVLTDITAHLEGKSDSYINEHRIKCKDGSFKWILARGMIVSRDTDGSPIRMVGSHSDISQRKQAQIKAEEYLVTIDNNVISSTTDLNGKIIKVSQALCDISGYSKSEFIGKNHSILRHPDMPSAVYKELWKTIKSGNIWEGEIKNKHKDGTYYWVKSTIVPEYDKDHNIIGYSSVRHDITPQKAKEDFMANMSHELRTPLNAIIGFSGILNNKIENIELKELSNQINQSSYLLLNLVNDILDLAKIQDSKFRIQPFEFNAYKEIVKLLSQIEGLTAKKVLIFNTHIGNNLRGTFKGDWNRISQIILNLISNSIKFTPEDGIINIDIDYEKNSMIISIEDNGIGMKKEAQDRIFKPFEQADGSTTRKYGGTGLGLSVTQNLVELMNGKIELQSQEGVGTIFVVTIDLKKISDNVTEDIEKVTVAEVIPLNVHILVAEDNLTNQMLIEMILDSFGVTCDIANDGLEAVQMYNPDIHKLILMDENMPNMNGVKAMQIIKEKYKQKCGAIIALTANAMQEDEDRFLKLGMDAYIAKPIDNNKLYNTIKKLLPK